MTCEKCATAGSILRRTWNAQGGLARLCQSCWVPREPVAKKPVTVDALRNIPCDFYPERPQARTRAFGGPQGDGKPKNGQGGASE